MEDWMLQAESVCMRCGGHCCDEAHPPISSACYQRLTKAGVPEEMFEYEGYSRVKTKKNGECALLVNGRCSVHSCKPETCRAGPFTFDVRDATIEIFLKFESICPMVRMLKEVPEAYLQQYNAAVGNIAHLVRNLSDEELASVCQIDEPETEKVAEIPRWDGASP
jgi:Fe-S-cluster containining protein